VSSIGKILLIVRREFLERVRTKAFIIGTILIPILLGGLMFMPFLLGKIMPEKAVRITVVDEAGGLYKDVDQALSSDEKLDFLKAKSGAAGGAATGEKVRRYQLQEAKPASAAPESTKDLLASLSTKVEDGTIDAYLVLPADVLTGTTEPTYFGRTVSDINSTSRIERALSTVFVARRLSVEGIDPSKAKELTRRVDMQTIKIGEKGQQSKKGFIEEYIATMIFVVILYANLILYGTALSRSLIEEKMNRVIEVLLSSVTPFELMAGKIVGIGSVGLAQFLIWVTAAIGFSAARGRLGLDESASFFEASTLLYFLLYFVLGYFLYAALFCIVGAICTTEQEAQQAQQPIVVMIVIPMAIAFMIIQQPASTLARVMSHVPFFSPIIMFMRINILPPPAIEIVVNVLVCLATIAVVVWAASRIFRVGILMTGKRATIPEIARWMRAS
jgi:ABC-2 type transport system permease protein